MRRLISSREGRTTYSVLYKARVVEIDDDKYEGRIKVYIPELNLESPIYALPLRDNLGSFKVPELNSTVYVILDQESPNTCYYISSLTEYHDKPNSLYFDEYVPSLPMLQEKLLKFDGSDTKQDRWFVQFHSVYSSEHWWRIPNRLAYENYKDHKFKASRDQSLFEGKVVRVRQSLDLFYGNHEESHREIYIIPNTGHDENKYQDKSLIFKDKVKDKLSTLSLLVASYQQAKLSIDTYYTNYDLPILSNVSSHHRWYINAQSCGLEKRETFLVKDSSQTDKSRGLDRFLLTCSYFQRITAFEYLGSPSSSYYSTLYLDQNSGYFIKNLSFNSSSNLYFYGLTNGTTARLEIQASNGQNVYIVIDSVTGSVQVFTDSLVEINTTDVVVNASNSISMNTDVFTINASSSFTVNAGVINLNP